MSNTEDTLVARWIGSYYSGTVEMLQMPEFENAGKVHDWRNHVWDAVRSIWETLSLEQRAAVAIDAKDRASNEEWD